MTNLDALKATTGLNYPLSENTFQKALIDAGVTPADDYAAVNAKPVDLAAARIMLNLIASVDSVSEGGYTVTLGDKTTLVKLYNYYAVKYPSDLQPFDKPFLKGASYKW